MAIADDAVTVGPEVLCLEDSSEAARAIGLRYVTDADAGFARRRRGKGFCYVDERGRPLRAKQHLERIRMLVIPPAWTDVWICPSPNGHLQATGRDARRRKQHRYHPRWRAFRDQTKYSRLAEFSKVLPRIHRQTEADLRRQGIGREKVLALVVRLLEETHIRVGNPEYARDNNSVGLTTMRDKHVDARGDTVRFCFRGKSGVEHEVDFRSPRLARLVRRCQELPGQQLFQYIDDEGQRRAIGSQDVNDYLRQITGANITAKDFRTWAGTVMATEILSEMGPANTESEAKKNVLQAIREIADRLGNRPATCRKYYVHPAVLAAYLDGSLFAPVGGNGRAASAAAAKRTVLRLLKHRA